jgi:hypothetical protein
MKLDGTEFQFRLAADFYDGVEFDVYHHLIPMPNGQGKMAYVKLYIDDSNRIVLVVSSFKEK